MTAHDAYRAARLLAEHGHLDADAVTTADLAAAADIAGAGYPSRDEQDVIRLALAALTGVQP